MQQDITMCTGKDCPFKEKCARATTPPKEYQSYFVKPPFVSQTSKPVVNVVCEYFIKNGIQ